MKIVAIGGTGRVGPRTVVRFSYLATTILPRLRRQRHHLR